MQPSRNHDDVALAALDELLHLRRLGNNEVVAMATANLTVYEAILLMICSGDKGIPVYQTLERLETKYASHSGVLKRLRVLRKAGLIEDKPGEKKSEVRLVVSDHLLDALGPILRQKLEGK